MNFYKKSLALLSLALGLSACGGPAYEGTLLPMDGTEYNRYFIVKGLDQNTIADQIQEYGDLWAANGQTPYEFHFTSSGDWQIVKMDSELPFYQYHNLITWFIGTDGAAPEVSIGLALHTNDPTQSYLAFTDPNNSWGDTQLAVFQDGTEAFIYLPEAYEPQGNLKVLATKLTSFADLAAYLSSIGFDQSILENSLDFETKEMWMETL